MILAALACVALILTVAVFFHLWRIVDSILLATHAKTQVVNVSTDMGAVLPVLANIIKRYVPDTSGIMLVEPGAGFGHVSRALSRLFPWKDAVAIEISTYSLVIAKMLNRVRPSKLRFEKGDLFGRTFAPGSFVYLYISTAMLEKLKPRLKGCLVASLTFEIPGEKPVETIELPSWQRQLLVYDFR